MVTSWKKCRRTSSEHAAPRRRDALKKLVVKIVHPRSSSIVPESDSEYMQNPETKNYRGVRYRVELNKYVTEIRPSRSTKKIWLGTYDTAEEAARAFDIGNLCCKKNLPLNFPDSPRMLKKISSRLTPDATRNAIAKLAKEVARVVSLRVSSDRAAAEKAIELLQQENEAPEDTVVVKTELQTQNLETGSGSSGVTYTEILEEQVDMMDYQESSEVATSMPLQAGGEGGSGSGYSGSFDVYRMFTPDDNANVPLHMLINFRSSESKYGDVLVHTYP